VDVALAEAEAVIWPVTMHRWHPEALSNRPCACVRKR